MSGAHHPHMTRDTETNLTLVMQRGTQQMRFHQEWDTNAVKNTQIMRNPYTHPKSSNESTTHEQYA